MSEHKARRGRPKGSEIDDSGQLRAIAKLIADDPELKPTTAIRSLGITDQSTIRRLRDKFNSRRDKLMASVERLNSTVQLSDAHRLNRTVTRSDNAPHTVALDSQKPELISQPLAPETFEEKNEEEKAVVLKKNRSNQRATKKASEPDTTNADRNPKGSSDYLEPCLRGRSYDDPLAFMAAWWSVGMKTWATATGIAFAMTQQAITAPYSKAAIQSQIEVNTHWIDAFRVAGFEEQKS